ncbi:MAG TPA: Holliday junction resolvase RuvX [Candidatus Moranbacteria bacterium]|nr:Holliday junction resolvase RuvX [Candidatus Moranbacteria bacterium]
MKKSIPSRNEAEISHYLGLDFGKAKIGLAIADNETRMAFAFSTLKNDKNFLQKLKEIVENENIKAIVIGITRHEKDQQSAEEKMEFAERVKKETGLIPFFQEEMFTTKMATENLKQSGQKNIAAKDDQEAARIILQSWLDKNSL